MACTLIDILRARAETSPEDRAYLFLVDGETEGPCLTYGELDSEARRIAVALRQVLGEQERAMLVYPPGLDFLAAYFGCLYAGVVAVPVYPPRPDFLRPGAEPLAAFARDCQPAAILSTGEMLAELQSTIAGCPALAAANCLATDKIDASLSRSWRPPPIADDWLAMLQYTSGSTRSPRGVMVSHANLMHNEDMLHEALEHRGPGTGVCWLPPYHDMGLIGGLLQTAYHGAMCVVMSPVSFLQHPFRWLAAVSKYRADTSGGPGFAYDLCVDRTTPEQRATLDLRHWGVAAIGAEPIRPETLERFSTAFGDCGFQHQAWYPAYGLAEATTFSTGGAKGAPPRVVALERRALADGSAVAAREKVPAPVRLVGCGHPWHGQRLAIIDPATQQELPAGRVGEIWLSGLSVARGYWNRPQETHDVFQLRLGQENDDAWLRTGDLGFVLDEELFITGRWNDSIVIYGRNHAPQDIEETVQEVSPLLRSGCGAAFETLRDGIPKLVVVQEVSRRGRELNGAVVTGDVRQAIREQHDLHLHELVLVDSGSIPKTSSGKVQRHACRRAYEEASLRIWNG